MYIHFILITIGMLFISFCMKAQDTVYYELWDIDNLERIGGHEVTVLGDPAVVSTELGNAVEFDGDGDRLLVHSNPIGESKEFTVELIFWPDACYPNNTDPRFVHIQDPDDPQNKRVMIELRLNASNECYLDGFILTDIENLALIDETLTHPTETWLHAAITYKDGVFKTYMEREEELSGNVAFRDMILGSTGKTSLGARMDARNWYRGKMKTLKVTRKALQPEEFLEIKATGNRDLPSGKSVPGSSVYPVPAGDVLTVLPGDHHRRQLNIKILDVVGRNIYSGEVNHGTQSEIIIHTSEIQSGFYLVQLISEGITETRRIFIQH